MSRLIVGPFNRVEGDLEVQLEVEDGRLASARVATTLYRGFEQILLGRPPADALVIAPRVCGICSVSQSLAAAAALRALAGAEVPENGALCANIAHAAENIADHLSHFYLFFMPDFARAFYADEPWHGEIAARFRAVSGSAAAQVLPARAKILSVMGLIAGKWPHSLSFQPGGVTRSLDLGEKMRLVAVLSEFRAFAETVFFGAPLEAMAALETPAQLDAYADGPGDFAAFLRLGRRLGLDRLGRLQAPLLSFGAYHGPGGPLFPSGVFDGATRPLAPEAIGEEVAASFFRDGPREPAQGRSEPDMSRKDAYSFAKAPRLAGQPAETGALARQAVAGDALARALIAEAGGTSVFSRVVARGLEIAKILIAAEGWAQALRLDQAFYRGVDLPASGSGVGMVEAARGALGHWLSVEKGFLRSYQIIAPTSWNFSPRDGAGVPGPLEQALVGLELGEAGTKHPAIQHVVRSFDPCMVCTAH